MTHKLELRNVSYQYPDSHINALSHFNLAVNQGEFIIVRGDSGSGKTTLLKCACGLVPQYTGGVFSGSVLVNGLDTLKHPVEEIASDVGMVFQDPENQLACMDVENEIAFGLENKRLSRAEIGKRILNAASDVGVTHLLNRKTNELSSGEKQKVILAAILAMKPGVLLLDEPFSQLDRESVEHLTNLLFKINARDKTTIIMVEHTFTAFEKVDRVVYIGRKPSSHSTSKPALSTVAGDVVIRVSNLSYSYTGNSVLHGLNLVIRRGEFIAVAGPNGSGKTTLLKHFNGLLLPRRGDVFINAVNTKKTTVEELASKVGFLSQNPGDYLFSDTVEDELQATLRNLGKKGDVVETLRKFGLYELRHQYPRDLSGGERQRVALASILVAKPEILVLDEPTRGSDASSKSNLIEALSRLQSSGTTIIISTHDPELASQANSRVTLMEGRIASDTHPHKTER
jgi:energy-coupling factor transporter ATP-binding protein EcfA2